MQNSMKALIWYGKDDIRFEDREIPLIGDDEALIKIAYAGICGSDIHFLNGRYNEKFIRPPQVIGHEFSGTIAKIGKNVSGYKIGDRVTAHPFGGCGECYFCKRAQENFCLNPFNVLCQPRAGAFAEYTAVKAKQLYKLSENISLKTAALIEPASIAIHAMDFSNIKTGYTAVVVGGGTIGLFCLQVALRMGAGLAILSDPVDSRLRIAKEIGADIVVNPVREDLKRIIMEVTNGLGVDTYVEAVGLKSTCEQAISLTKNCGTIVIVGLAPQDTRIEISPYEVNTRELTIKGSNWSPYSFIRTIGLLGKLKTEPLITHVFALYEIEKALAVQRSQKGLKVLLKARQEISEIELKLRLYLHEVLW